MNLDIWSTPTLRGRGTSEIQYGDRKSDPTDVQGIIRGSWKCTRHVHEKREQLIVSNAAGNFTR